MSRIVLVLLVLAAAAFLVALPAFGGLATLNLANKIMIAAVFALGFNLLWGQAGLPSFGHAAYYGVGTFATIYMMDAIDRGGSFPTPLLPLVGAGAGFLFGLVAGWFATVRSGVYFAMITVAIAELLSALAQKWEGLFGGEAGIRSIRANWGPLDFQSTDSVYYLTLAWTLLVLLSLWALQRSPFGLIVRGIRERELRIRFLGYDAHRVKTVVFALSAAVSGLAGGLLAISDESASMVLFGGAGSAFVVLNTVIGGAGVFLGPVIGAALTTSFAYFGAGFSHFWPFYLGVVFVVTVLYAPEGLGGAILSRWRRVQSGSGPALSARDLAVLAGSATAMAGLVLLIEMTGAICSEAYRAEIGVLKGVWPPVRVFGVDFAPLSPIPWLLGLAALLGGGRVALSGGRPTLPRILAGRLGTVRPGEGR